MYWNSLCCTVLKQQEHKNPKNKQTNKKQQQQINKQKQTNKQTNNPPPPKKKQKKNQQQTNPKPSPNLNAMIHWFSVKVKVCVCILRAEFQRAITHSFFIIYESFRLFLADFNVSLHFSITLDTPGLHTSGFFLSLSGTVGQICPLSLPFWQPMGNRTGWQG